MAKYNIKKSFTGKEEGKTFKKGYQTELTVKRADEINKVLKKHGEVLERINETPEE